MPKTSPNGRFHPIWLGMTAKQRTTLAAKLETSEGYLQHLAGGVKMPSMHFARRLVRAVPGVTYDGIIDAYYERHGNRVH